MREYETREAVARPGFRAGTCVLAHTWKGRTSSACARLSIAEPVDASENLLSSEAISELNQKLTAMRHNVNNHLALVMAASELMRRRPEMSPRLIENISQQPDKITAEIRIFSESFESTFGCKRKGPPIPNPPAR